MPTVCVITQVVYLLNCIYSSDTGDRLVRIISANQFSNRKYSSVKIKILQNSVTLVYTSFPKKKNSPITKHTIIQFKAKF